VAEMGSCLLAHSSRYRSVSSLEICSLAGREKENEGKDGVSAYLSTNQQLNQLALRLVCEFPLFLVACWLAFDHDAEFAFNLLCWRHQHPYNSFSQNPMTRKLGHLRLSQHYMLLICLNIPLVRYLNTNRAYGSSIPSTYSGLARLWRYR
jgi:hypothetical protein